MADLHMRPCVAAGNIRPSVVVKTQGAGVDFGVLTCGNGATSDIPFGIAQNWTEGAPGTPFDTGYAASTGKRILVWAAGATAVAAVQNQGSTLAAGALVGPNVNGEIISATSGWAVGYLLEAGSASLRWRLRVYVHPMRLTSGSTS